MIPCRFLSRRIRLNSATLARDHSIVGHEDLDLSSRQKRIPIFRVSGRRAMKTSPRVSR